VTKRAFVSYVAGSQVCIGVMFSLGAVLRTSPVVGV
jgi:hypothetical protein